MIDDLYRKKIVAQVELHIAERCEKFLEENDYDNVDCLFKEFVINGEEPNEWMFLEFIGDVFENEV